MPSKRVYSDGTTPSVCIIGAGVGGMCAAIQLKRKLGLSDIMIIDRNQDFGGVWFKNTYPGARTHAPGLVYSFSFDIMSKGPHLYPTQEEMCKYTKKLATKYELYSTARFNTTVKSIVWNSARHIWLVESAGSDGSDITEEFNLVIVATGTFREPNYPDIFKKFDGPMFHSSDWNHNVRLENKVVAVVGTGASAVQVVPATAPKASELIVYQRTPVTCIPNPVPNALLLLLAVLPFLAHSARLFFLLIMDLAIGIANTCPRFFGWIFTRVTRVWIALSVYDRSLRKKLTPTTTLNGRPALSNTFYRTFNLPNVKLHCEHVVQVDGNRIVTADGNSKKVDVLILCTGFKPQEYFSPIRVVGVNGVDLLDLWKQAWPRTFYGTTCNETPNMFFIGGPNSSSHANSAIQSSENQCNFIVSMVTHLIKENLASFQVKESAQDEAWAYVKANMEKCFWNKAKAGSWSSNSLGEGTIVWPSTVISFWWKLRRVDPAKFNFESRKCTNIMAGGKYQLLEIV